MIYLTTSRILIHPIPISISMKNKNLQELRPIYVQESSNHENDEINLIDLAMVLIRHKAVFTIILVFFLVLGTAAALLIPQQYTYTTTIEIGRQVINNNIEPLDSAQTLLSKLQHGYIPKVLVDHRLSQPDDNNKYEVKSTISGNAGHILLIEIESSEDKAIISKDLLHTISQIAIQDHTHLYQSIKSSLESSLKETTNRLKALENNISNDNNNESEIAEILTVIETIKFQLANLRNTREVLSTVRSVEPTGISPLIMIIISTFSGIILGIFSAFSAELAANIKKRQMSTAATHDINSADNG